MSQEPPTTSSTKPNNNNNIIAANIIIPPSQSEQLLGVVPQIQKSMSTVLGSSSGSSSSSSGVTGSPGVVTLTPTTAATPVNNNNNITRTLNNNNNLAAVPANNSRAPTIMQVPKSQDVRVDNWGNYCLQRLQVMYDRGDFCDLILQFHNNQILKVHRVVVNLCTEYFANLERLFGLQAGMLVLPKDVEYSTMVTIVKFFYTGKLEVKGAQFNDIYRTVKLMNILILTKLLEAHARKPIAMAKKEPNMPIVFKQAVEIGRPLQKVPGQSAIQGTSTIKYSAPTTMSSKTISRPLPPGVKTKTVLARVQPQTIRVGNQVLQGKLSTPKKLPIWKERKYAPATNSDPLMMEKWPPRDEPPRPTRFEWPDPSESDDDPYVTPASHALMERQKAAASSATLRKAEDIFDAVKTQTHGVKRTLGVFKEGDQTGTLPGDESPASKVAKLNSSSMEEVPSSSESMNISLNSTDMTTDVSQISDVNLTDEVVEEIVSTTEGYNQDSIESDLGDAPSSVEEASLLNDSSISFTTATEIPTPSTSKTVEIASHSGSVQTKRSSLKSSVGSHKGEKTVRFAPEVSEKENKNKPAQQQQQQPQPAEIVTPIVISRNLESVNASNHSRIISEVLKKYPDLVKDSKNIKLKIVQKEADLPSAAASAVNAASKDAKTKISYIVLKSTSSPDSAGSVVLKKPGVANKSFWESDKIKKPPSGAENVTGPWLCIQCGSEEIPQEFESYYNYRRHLVEVHAERIDARICEYCGHKASKRNLLLYHLYTKHGVTPPKNCVFPHCDRCDYVALSESLLTKHKHSHDSNKEFPCEICNASFKSNSALQGHMAANLHRNKDTKVYECPYCRKPFVRNINLKAHIRSLHKDVARIEEMEDPRLPPDDSLSNRNVSVVHQGTKKRQFPSILGAARLQTAVIPENVEEVQHGMDGLVRSLVTADGQTIEILQGIDPAALSVPVLVPSSEAGSLSLEAQHAGHVGTEYMTGVNSDGSQAVFIMDSSQNTVEVDMSSVGVGMAPDGSMVFEGGDPTGGSDQYIVQDLQGNQFRKITGIDEKGNQMIFFQLQDENGQVTMAPAILDDGSVARYEDAQGDGTAQFDFDSGQATFSVQNDHMYLDPQKCSVFVSSGGVTLPVTVSSDAVGGQAAQVLLSNLGASVPPGHVIEFHTGGESLAGHEQNVVVTTESLMNQVHQGHVQLQAVGPEHHHHLLQDQSSVEAMRQQLHIVLGQNQVGVLDGSLKAAASSAAGAASSALVTDTSAVDRDVAEKLHAINQTIDAVHLQVAEAMGDLGQEQLSAVHNVAVATDESHDDDGEEEQEEEEELQSQVLEEVVTSEAPNADDAHLSEETEQQQQLQTATTPVPETSNISLIHNVGEAEQQQLENSHHDSQKLHLEQQQLQEEVTVVPPLLEEEETGNGQVEFQECMQIDEGVVGVEEQQVELQECMETEEEGGVVEGLHVEQHQVQEIEIQEHLLVQEEVGEEEVIEEQEQHHEQELLHHDHHHEQQIIEGVQIQDHHHHHHVVEEETISETVVAMDGEEEAATQLIIQEEEEEVGLQVSEALEDEQQQQEQQEHEIVEEVVEQIITEASNTDVETQELMVEDAVVDVI